MTSIGTNAFREIKGLQVNLSNTLWNLSKDTFGENPTIIYGSNDLSYLLWSLWPNFEDIYDTAGNALKQPVLAYESTPTSLKLFVSPYMDDFSYEITGDLNMPIKDEPIEVTGLDPKSYKKLGFKITFEGESRIVSNGDYYPTTDLILTIQQPKVISVGNVIVAAESNIANDEETVGFEWRRTDWTDDFESNRGGAYLYEGTMEGYIRNLNAEKLWKFRPYYESSAGNRYYGKWVGLDPSNTSYFEPTVHTYAKILVQGNSAEVKGYAMRGTDNMTSQGFKYWKTSGGLKAPSYGPQRIAVPQDAMTVEAKGNVMTASLTGLSYDTEYCYVAFVTTSEGETFYGEQQTFKTGIDTTPVISVGAEKTEASVVARYDLNGHRIAKPVRGVNILLMSDGTMRKVVMK